MCPYCRTNAPLVYRGLNATCAACGRKRMVLSGSSLTHAGTGSAVGGSIVRVFGWATLLVGLFLSLGIGLVIALFSAIVGLVVGGGLGLFTLLIFLLLNKGGKQLEASGKETQEARREQALVALAQNKGGTLQAFEAASALDLSVDEADGFLTRMAKQQPDVVGVDIGDQGEIFYTFLRIVPVGAPMPRVRIDARRGPEVSSAPQARPPVDPKVIDADFEAIEEDPVPPRRRTS